MGDLLSVFLHRALYACVDDRFLKLKPHLVLEGVETLDPYLSGYQYPVLLETCFAAGARSVQFSGDVGPVIPQEFGG